MTARATVLVVLQTMFLARVLGQVLVVLIEPRWLPSPEHWYSGLLPYHVLLPAQILLLMFMSLVTYDAIRGEGRLHVESGGARTTLRNLAKVYVGVMILRYVLTMTFAPELRWFGHTIPIFFHFVLAAYLYTLGSPAHEAAPVTAYRSSHLSSRS